MIKYQAKIIITGGGTGGHLFPGIAIAEEFRSRDQNTGILFAGTGNAFEKRVLGQRGFALKAISAKGLKGMGIMAKIKSILTIPAGMLDAFKIIRSFQPDMIIGMGGYSSGPVILTAWLMGVKTAIHEQNTIPGITNRILSRIVARIFISFERTGNFPDKKKTLLVGNPVRKGFLCKSSDHKTPSEKKTFTILITGGSQGAHGINMAMLDALPSLSEKKDLLCFHQTGADDEKILTDAYLKNKIKHQVKCFFDNMDTLYSQSDLIICRSGATTIAEITAMGKAALFVPYPFAADNHQEFNARAMEEKNAAIMIVERDLTGIKLSARIDFLRKDSSQLTRMEKCSKELGHPMAAANIVNDCLKGINK